MKNAREYLPPPDKRPREYTKEIMAMNTRQERLDALAAVPEILRPTVERLVQIGWAIKNHSARVVSGGGLLQPQHQHKRSKYGR